jgi:hypothetical protein
VITLRVETDSRRRGESLIPQRWRLLAVECSGLAVLVAGCAVYWRTGDLHHLASVPVGVKLLLHDGHFRLAIHRRP